jgi:hypothetical protein
MPKQNFYPIRALLKVLKFFTFIAVFGVIFSIITKANAADLTPPVTTYVQTPATPDGKFNWYKSIVRFDLTSTDLESGVKEINYKVDANPWVKISFTGSLNLAPDPSFEKQDSSWQADAGTVFSYDNTNYAPNFATTSTKITSSDTGWHGINNRDVFAVATSYSNMSAAVYLKTDNVVGTASYKVFAISQNALGEQTVAQVAQSNTVTGTTDWTSIPLNFVVNAENVIGVYLNIGINGTGTVWADAVSISASTLSATTTFTVGSDSTNHTVSFYATDLAGNVDTTKTISFKQDTTPPGNWNDSGAFRGLLGPSDHHLYVYTNVQDEISGISTFTDRYQIHTEKDVGFGRYDDIMKCSSTWEPNGWTTLITPPFIPGAHSAYLLTPKTDFCDNNWKICKTVRFYSEDMAGNSSTKDFCINGPWIEIKGSAITRSNNIIDMLSEANGDNTDGLIETGGNLINFFTTSKDWKVRKTPTPSNNDYDDYLDAVVNPTPITNGNLVASNGKYIVNGDLNIGNSSIPNSYATAEFNQVVFVSGNLTVSKNLQVGANSTALFIVKGDAEISKTVDLLGIAIIADGDFYTAYDINEGETANTLVLNGIFQANKFNFQRTLQGTNNSDTPSESFTFEPKYAIQLKTFFGKYGVRWLSIE